MYGKKYKKPAERIFCLSKHISFRFRAFRPIDRSSCQERYLKNPSNFMFMLLPEETNKKKTPRGFIYSWFLCMFVVTISLLYFSCLLNCKCSHSA